MPMIAKTPWVSGLQTGLLLAVIFASLYWVLGRPNVGPAFPAIGETETASDRRDWFYLTRVLPLTALVAGTIGALGAYLLTAWRWPKWGLILLTGLAGAACIGVSAQPNYWMHIKPPPPPDRVGHAIGGGVVGLVVGVLLFLVSITEWDDEPSAADSTSSPDPANSNS